MNSISNLLSKLPNLTPGQEDVKSSQEAKEDSKQISEAINALYTHIVKRNFFHLTPEDNLKKIPVQFHSSEQIGANIGRLSQSFKEECKSHSEALFTNNVLKTLDIAKKYFSESNFSYEGFYNHFYKTFIRTEEKNSSLTDQEKLTTLFLLKQGLYFRPFSAINAFQVFCSYIDKCSSHDPFIKEGSAVKASLFSPEASKSIIRRTLGGFEKMHPHCHSLLIKRDQNINTILNHVIDGFANMGDLVYSDIRSSFYEILVPQLEENKGIEFTNIQKDTAFLLFKQTMVLMYQAL